MTKDAPISIRLNGELKEALKALADAEHRTLSNYIELILRRHVQNEAPPPKTKLASARRGGAPKRRLA